MPFGVVNASAVFNRMMQRLLQGLSNVVSYIDDVLLYTTNWHSNVKVVREVLQRNAGLTGRPTKCCFGFPTHSGLFGAHGERGATQIAVSASQETS